MTLYYKNNLIALLDSRKWFDGDVYLPNYHFQFKNSIFNIKAPFYREICAQVNSSNDIQSVKKRKRKMTADNDIHQFIDSAWKSLITNLSDYFEKDLHPDLFDECNNDDAIILGLKVEEFTKLADKTHAIKYSTDDIPKYFHDLISNATDNWTLINCLGDQYVLPPQSAFIMCDIQYCNSILTENFKEFDFIVMDPPWINKSVKRKKNYFMLTDIDILRLPIRKLIKSTGLVAIWCTGSDKIREQLIDQFLPAWNLHLLGTWYWLKVTKFGQPVLNIDNTFRHPYEFLYITCPNTPSTIDQYKSLPQRYCFASIPACMHSSKPPILDLLSEYLCGLSYQKPKCLELFARNLTSGFTSWGNEPIKLQKCDLLFDLQRKFDDAKD